MVRGISPDLLGRHVTDGAEDDARPGCGRDRTAIGAAVSRLELPPEPGQAEVQDLHPSVPHHEDVLGLQVPVDDPLLVGCGQALRDLHGVVDGLAPGKTAVPEPLSQGRAIE